MADHNNGLSEGMQERLVLLAEEAAEIIQAVSKILRHGATERHPLAPTTTTNLDDLMKEIGHIWLAIEMLTVAGDVKQDAVVRSMYHKSHELDQYLHHQPLSTLKELRDRFTVGE